MARRHRALILIREQDTAKGVSSDRQIGVCMGYLEQAGYTLAGLLQSHSEPEQAAALIGSGAADVVVAAWAAADELVALVEQAGGRTEFVHRPERRNATVRSMLAVLYREEGWSVPRLAHRFGIDQREVADHLRRTGIRRPE
jgi:hypothetical protein